MIEGTTYITKGVPSFSKNLFLRTPQLSMCDADKS